MTYITHGSLLVRPPQRGLILVMIMKNGNVLEQIHKVWTAMCTDIQDSALLSVQCWELQSITYTRT